MKERLGVRLKRGRMQRNFKEKGTDTVEIKYLVVIPKEIFLTLWIISSLPTILIYYVQ